MAELAAVRRYARALFDTARREGTVDQVEEDLKAVDQVLRAVPRLTRALGAPTLSTARKKALLETAFGPRVSPLTLRFLNLLLDRRREGLVGHIFPEFVRLANEWRNVLPVEVTAAVPLTDEEREALAGALGRRTGKSIRLQVQIEPKIMGGMWIRMGDTIIDGSVRSRLRRLHQRLLSGRGA
ncbi:MAG: F0F1 ATP synthase subunit delta [Armatimonadota bacterium]